MASRVLSTIPRRFLVPTRPLRYESVGLRWSLTATTQSRWYESAGPVDDDFPVKSRTRQAKADMITRNHIENVRHLNETNGWKPHPPPVNQAIEQKWRLLFQLEENYMENIIEIIKLRKELNLTISDEDLKMFRDEEENRDLTIAALRHTYHDPTGKSLQVDFTQKLVSSQKPKKSPWTKKVHETEEDRWLTKRSHEFAKKA